MSSLQLRFAVGADAAHIAHHDVLLGTERRGDASCLGAAPDPTIVLFEPSFSVRSFSGFLELR